MGLEHLDEQESEGLRGWESHAVSLEAFGLSVARQRPSFTPTDSAIHCFTPHTFAAL